MKKITLEEHFLPPENEAHVASTDLPENDFQKRMTSRLTDLEQYRLSEMDAYGIATQVLSLNAPGIQAETDTNVAIKKAKQINDFLAEIIRKHPTRYAGFAALPLQDPGVAADELERTVTQLGFKGAMINGHTNGEFLDEPKFRIVWERAEGLGVPLYLHPGNTLPGPGNGFYAGYPELLGPTWNWGVETATHALRLVFGGVFDEFPHATLILGHLGEMLPYALWRLDTSSKRDTGKKKIQKLPSQYIRENMVITTSGHFSQTSLLCALLTLGADRILFSVDYPYASTEEAARFIETAPLSDTDKEKICHLNAERQLGL
ncbi:MAG: amidohydrolase family protein [Ktedonobacteraceae bacterium]